jgi:HD superfamily phosphohydrolase
MADSPTNSEASNVDSADDPIAVLEHVYSARHRDQEFRDEREVHVALLPLLRSQLLELGYSLEKPFALGSTATVWLVRDRHLQQSRALKLTRPRLGRLASIVRIVRAEQARLATLNHQNIVKIYTAGEIELVFAGEQYSFPYFVMEFLEGVEDFDDYITKHYRVLTASDVITYFRNALLGIDALHSRDIIHCDIKPGNILIAPHRPALIADLGYAKHIAKISETEQKFTDVTYTQRYAHPELRKRVKHSSDPAANVSTIERSQLSRSFDLFAFGRSMQDVLAALRGAESASPDLEYGRVSVFSKYQWLYLSYISKRLLDGIVENSGQDDNLTSDLIPGLPAAVMDELKYTSAEQALDDFEKLLHLYDLEGEVPELNPDTPRYIQIPHCRVPLTSRVQAVIDHPTYARLGDYTQLGFVCLVYPGARHTRFEHCLGVFANTCDYARSLWYDQENCLFQMIMAPQDIAVGLLAGLLHDIAQFPMAHDLAEIDSGFDHERFTRDALEQQPNGYDESLASVVASVWGVEVHEVLRVLEADEHSTFRERLLHSMISGPLDCDKLDYLRRDSTHIGVTFGHAIDQGRLLRNLTIVYGTAMEKGLSRDGRQGTRESLSVASIGVTEKALAVSEAILRARSDMHTQVYWQHSVRAMKAMLAFVVRRVLARLKTEEERASFATTMFRSSFDGSLRPSGTRRRQRDFSEVPDEKWLALTVPVSSAMAYSDQKVLHFFEQHADEDEKMVLAWLMQRKLFRRLAVLQRSKSSYFETVYNTFRAYRLEGNCEALESQRKRWEQRIIEETCNRLAANGELLPRGETLNSVAEALKMTKPLVLIDVPIKAVKRKTREEFIMYLPEEPGGSHMRPTDPLPHFDRVTVHSEQREFDLEVGKVRVLAHPDWAELLIRVLPTDLIANVLVS